jgi:hypothetical protein
MHSNENPASQRSLPFEDEEIWMKLPEPVREQCRSLWHQVLASVVKSGERRQDEREN